MPILEKILNAGEGRQVRRLKKVADAVNSIEDDYTDLSDAELQALTDQYRERLADGESLDDLLPEAFATAREAARRVLGQRAYDVQVMGGAALHYGNIAEMKTGEGKTLTGVLPAYLNALAGKGVHLVTVNDYLASRDAEWMGQVHRFLGLTVGAVLPGQTSADHKAAYECDITYGTNNEFGFDYLRDNMAMSAGQLVQRGHFFAIVDEVDSILIDEARTPLIISGPAEHSQRWYPEFAQIVARMQRGTEGGGDYEVDEAKRTVAITERGVAKVEDRLGIENLYEPVNTPLVGYLNNAIKAKELYRKDKEYIVNSDGEVLIVDEFTGRVLAGRRFSEGMHQAIEAKEGVKIKQENQTLATITLQNYFRLYDKLAGMTGTAQTEASEFNKVYDVGVITIPTHLPMVRLDKADVIYKTEKAKFEALVEDIVERHQLGQPVLVGTTSVDKSEILATMLKRRGIPHNVLNAKFHAKEAEFVAQAGRKGAVTVATNMAGRGTDILLGGNPEYLAAAELRQQGFDPVEQPEEYAKALETGVAKWRQVCDGEGEEVVAAGGLYVLGTERHDARRIDNQLRGRAGRQGDPGESRFYLSLQDDLMRRFRASAVESVMERLNIPDDVPIESKMVSRQIKSAQTQIEGQNAEIRKNVLKYDEVLNQQRQVVYAERKRVLDGEDLRDQVRHMLEDVVGDYISGATNEGYAEDWDLDQLWSALKQLYPVGLTIDELLEEVDGDRSALEVDQLRSRLLADVMAAYERREEELGEATVREVERQVVLSVIDRKWREHLYEMDYLKEGIGLRQYAQRNPVVEYQREGFAMFQTMLEGIKEESVRLLFNAEVRVQQPEAEAAATPTQPAAKPAMPLPVGQSPVEVRARGLRPAQAQPQNLQYSAPTVDGEAGSGGVTTERESDRPAAPALGLGRGPQVGAGPAIGAATAGRAAESQQPNRSGDNRGAADRSGGRSGAARQQAPGQAVGSAPSRNAPCPCGSGKKYKRCHGAPAGGA
ncbi:preprotein translocase subunit SecA [Natronosporangium hydrolyticum]|uniref:Protein translocase subunit SecA n=1 Tax=Natronosporangium hydrolyticum TaxID=2811111 RepID=A0A895YCG5_9ACTN|nr:preprotein translocase subunit SecA [Natronosporangium hydrolyticum]QSB13892.1 preprotein translocase subunit SecA [Natronosporangium hydrolyticum]